MNKDGRQKLLPNFQSEAKISGLPDIISWEEFMIYTTAHHHLQYTRDAKLFPFSSGCRNNYMNNALCSTPNILISSSCSYVDVFHH